MSGKHYPEEFKVKAVKQVVNRAYSVSIVATCLSITKRSLYTRIKMFGSEQGTIRCSG